MTELRLNVSYFKLNGKRIEIGKRGIPIFDENESTKRCSPRTMTSSSLDVEEELLDVMKSIGFRRQESVSDIWLHKIFKVRFLRFDDAKCVGFFFAKCFNETIFREYYRRKNALFYWLDQRITRIYKFCEENDVEVCFKDRLCKLKPMDDVFPKVEEEFTTFVNEEAVFNFNEPDIFNNFVDMGSS